MRDNGKAALLGLAAFGVFAVHDVVMKYLGQSYGPFQVLFFSGLFGFPLITLMLIHDTKADNLRPRHLWWGLVRTFALVGSTICVFYAFAHLPMTQTYAILFTTPLMVTVLAVPLLGERVGLHRGAAVVLGFVGVLIVVRPAGGDMNIAHLAALIGVFGSALAGVIVRKIGRDERDVVLLLFPMLGGFVLLGALTPLDYRPMPVADLGAAALLSVLSFAAFWFLISAYKKGDAMAVAPMQYSQIVWALMFGYLIFGETPDIQTLAGTGAIILSGAYILIREGFMGASKNMPALRSRQRTAAGAHIDVGQVLRLWRRRDRAKDAGGAGGGNAGNGENGGA